MNKEYWVQDGDTLWIEPAKSAEQGIPTFYSPCVSFEKGAVIMADETGSKPYGLSRDDLLKILKGGMVAVAGAALLAAASWLEALPGQIDFGPYEALAVVACQVGVNTIRKYVSDTQERILK